MGEQRTITAQELQSGIKIIGQLGRPLGEVASVQARFIASKDKEVERYIEVMEVAGKMLPTAVRLQFTVWKWGNLNGKELPLGKLLRLRIYETGGMAGIPLQAMKETVYIETADWQFRTSLVILFEEGEGAAK